MANPSKIPRVDAPGPGELQGFVHSVSPVKISARNKYFNVMFQVSRDQYHRGVVFTADKHRQFERAAYTCTPVGLSNIRKTSDKGGLHLTTTRSTTVEEIPAIEVPEAFSFTEAPAEVIFRTKGLVSGVERQERRTCSRCRQTQTAFDCKSLNHRCQSCRLLQKTVLFPAKVSGTVVLTSGSTDVHLTLTITVLREFLECNQLCHLLQDVQSIEEYLLNTPQLLVEHNDANMVTSMRLGTEVSGG
ncbi:hypothetical protein SRHO_G00252480 [Serrasalmus rhombeus]